MPHSRKLAESSDCDREGESSRAQPGPSPHNGEANPPTQNNSRRDENSISFRHFLQPQSDVVPVRHRNSRGANSGAIDLVDGAAMALPDFVQDHMNTEPAGAVGGISDNAEAATHSLHHTVSASGGGDVSNASAFHDYTPSQSSHGISSKRNRRTADSSNANGSAASSSSGLAQGPVALPDFLSDGPMHLSSNVTDGGGPNSASSSPNRSGGSSRLGSASGASRSSNIREPESLSQQVERLRREVSEKSRRVNQLESDLQRQKTELSMYEVAYLNSEKSLQAATRRALTAECRVIELRNELQLLKNPQLVDKMSAIATEAGSSKSPAVSEPLTFTQNGKSNSNLDANSVLEITSSAEVLVGELMGQLNALKFIALTSSKPDGELASSGSKGKAKSKEGSQSSK